MTTDQLRTWGWRAGLLLMIASPAIYILAFLSHWLSRGQSNALTQVILFAHELLPSIFLSVGAGAIVCLLVRIEVHLEALRSKDKS